jgi:hypothetical protein
MELSWNLCPYCGTPAPGKRRDKMTMDDVTRLIPVEEEASTEEINPEEESPGQETFEKDKYKDNGAL